jgi:REP element-mobilizing transposase RayT
MRNRHSIRLKGYDYSQSGAYFITICLQERADILGQIIDDNVHVSAAGEMVQKVWDEIHEYYPGVFTDQFIVMPDHVHGIIVLEPDDADNYPKYSIGGIIKSFKALTTKRYGNGIANFGWPSYNKRLWQRNYYEHIIRDEYEYLQIRNYIIANPENWETDEEYNQP